MLDGTVVNRSDGFHGVLRMGEHSIWEDPRPYPAAVEAVRALHEHVVGVFRSLFSLEMPDFDPALEVLGGIDPKWLEGEALERETFGGKSFTENVLDIIKERIGNAA